MYSFMRLVTNFFDIRVAVVLQLLLCQIIVYNINITFVA